MVNEQDMTDIIGHIISYDASISDDPDNHMHIVGRLTTYRSLPFFKKHLRMNVVHAFTVPGNRDLSLAFYEFELSKMKNEEYKRIHVWANMQDYYKNCRRWQWHVSDDVLV